MGDDAEVCFLLQLGVWCFGIHKFVKESSKLVSLLKSDNMIFTALSNERKCCAAKKALSSSSLSRTAWYHFSPVGQVSS